MQHKQQAQATAIAIACRYIHHAAQAAAIACRYIHHAAQATAIACMCMHAYIVPTAIVAQPNASMYQEAVISDVAGDTRVLTQLPSSPETEVWSTYADSDVPDDAYQCIQKLKKLTRKHKELKHEAANYSEESTAVDEYML